MDILEMLMAGLHQRLAFGGPFDACWFLGGGFTIVCGVLLLLFILRDVKVRRRGKG